jgi:hypothetical protein
MVLGLVIQVRSLLKKLEIIWRLEVYTKQMDMIMSDDDLAYGYIEDFFAKHVNPNYKLIPDKDRMNI